jgi:streptogramin lyase
MRLLSRFVIVIAATLLVAPAAANAAPVTEFTAGLRPASVPTGIALGPDGALWFTEQTLGGGIARITTTGAVTRYTAGLSDDAQPSRITLGPDGNLWFTENGHKGRVGRITPSGDVTEWGRGDDTFPAGITPGPDGNLWFAEPGKDGRITRIAPDGKKKDFTSGLTKGSAPTSITAGPDGNLWFTESVDPGRIGRITPAGVITEFPLTGAGGPPREITAGPDGNLWFTVGGGSGRVGRITPAGAVTLFAPLAAGADPQGIVAGPDGALYVAQRGRPAVARVTTDGAVTEIGGLPAGAMATGIAIGPEGALWLTGAADPGRILRVTLPPAVTAPTAASVRSTGATLGATVTDQDQATTFRIEYGPTPLYGSATADVAVPAGPGAQTVAAPVTGLSPNTTYHFRVVATNAGGTTYGPDATFATTPPGAPSATAQTATCVTPTSATLHGLVDAASAATTYRFEWGTSTAYDSPLPNPEPSVSAVAGDQPVSMPLHGLRPNTTYHFRVVATNVTGATVSSDRTFTTPPALPAVQAHAAQEATAEGVTLPGAVNPGNAPTVWYVEWGTTPGYGDVAAPEADTLTPGVEDRAVSVSLTGLAADTTYHYRLVAVNAAGTTHGPDRTFRTAALPAGPEPEPRAPSPAAAPSDAAPPSTPMASTASSAPRPALAKRVVVRPLSGTIRIRVPGSTRYQTLRDARAIPVGALVDAAAGRLTLTSALDARGRTQTGTFWGGTFRVRQSRGARGMTEIVLAGRRPASCGNARVAAVSAKRKRPRGVWGSDRHGRFRTRGSNSVATVRGTRWYVEERCDGTFTKVTSGSVVVRDLAKRRDVVVRAGRSYLARPRATRR